MTYLWCWRCWVRQILLSLQGLPVNFVILNVDKSCETWGSETVSKGIPNCESCSLKHHTTANLHANSFLYYTILSFLRPKLMHEWVCNFERQFLFLSHKNLKKHCQLCSHIVMYSSCLLLYDPFICNLPAAADLSKRSVSFRFCG